LDVRLIDWTLSNFMFAQEMADSCFDSMTKFLASEIGVEAERSFRKSGLYKMLNPGDIWRFRSAWEKLGVTALNVINALRPGDIKLYQDLIQGKQVYCLVAFFFY